jgi:hypothetical protein
MASEPVDFGEQCFYRKLGYALQRHDRCLSGVLATFTQSHWPECLLPINNLLDDDAQCLPVIIGAYRSARRSSTTSNDGVRDSRARGRPRCARHQAVEEVWPKTRGQRCCVHNTANVLNKLPNSRHPKKDALAAFDAFSR